MVKQYKPLKSSVKSTTSKSKTKPKATVDESRRLSDAKKYSVSPKAMTPQISPQPPKTAISAKGMTLRQIYAHAPRMMKENGEEMVFKSYKKLKTPKGLPCIKAVVVHRDPFKPRMTDCPHEVTVIGIDTNLKPIGKQRRVFISCNCEDHCYTWEYALAAHGATHIIYGNGEPPVMKNPYQIPGCCKHCCGVIARIIREGL